MLGHFLFEMHLVSKKSLAYAYDHIMLKAPVLVRSPKLSNIERS